MGIQIRKNVMHLFQCPINHFSDIPQRMIAWDSFLKGNVAEQ
jgi:hypothetical protein